MASPFDSGLPQIALNDRVAVFGGTGTGKSVFAHVLYSTIPEGWWKLIVDITDSVNDPTALTFFDPLEIPWDKSFSLRFVPDITADMDLQISELFLSIYAHGICFVWLDEANEVSDAHKTAFGLRKVYLQGRKAYVGVVSCTPRPKDISKSIITQAQYLVIFPLVDYDDRSTIAKNIGMTPAEFDDMVADLGDYEYLFYDVRNRDLWRMPPLPYELVDRLENPVIPEEEEQVG